MNKRHYIIPIFVPHVGCPNDCIFCNQRKITGISTDMTGSDVRDKIEEYLETIPQDNRVLEVAFFGGSFTGIDRDIQKEFLDIANSYKKRGIVNEIRLSTRPDYIDRERLDILKTRGVNTIELGVQSMDKEVLEASYRNHSEEDVYRAVELIREYDFKLGLQMMIGLPKDTLQKSLATAQKLIELKPHIARIYPTLVIKDTQLEEEYIRGNYKALSVDQAVYISKLVLYMMRRKNIKVIRIGLQPSDNISQDSDDLVAGPFHPSFRQLVEGELYYDAIRAYLRGLTSLEYKTVIISVNKADMSYVVGQAGKNRDRLMDEFELKKIKFESKKMKSKRFEISVVEDATNVDSVLKNSYREIIDRYSEV